MEFLVLASRYIRQPERERIVLEAVVEAAEAIGVNKVVKRRGNVYSTGVYINDGKEKSLLYNDWDKKWGRRRIFENIMTSVRLHSDLNQRHQIVLTID